MQSFIVTIISSISTSMIQFGDAFLIVQISTTLNLLDVGLTSDFRMVAMFIMVRAKCTSKFICKRSLAYLSLYNASK
jgi:hypothetical protein